MVFSHFSKQRKQREDKSFLQVFIHTADTRTQNFTPHSNIRAQYKPSLFGVTRKCSLEQITFMKRCQVSFASWMEYWCMVIATRLVEEEVWAVPWDGQHAPDQEQTLHNQVGGEGVAEEERSAILHCKQGTKVMLHFAFDCHYHGFLCNERIVKVSSTCFPDPAFDREMEALLLFPCCGYLMGLTTGSRRSSSREKTPSTTQ